MNLTDSDRHHDPDGITARPLERDAVVDMADPRLVVEYDPEPETSR